MKFIRERERFELQGKFKPDGQTCGLIHVKSLSASLPACPGCTSLRLSLNPSFFSLYIQSLASITHPFCLHRTTLLAHYLRVVNFFFLLVLCCSLSIPHPLSLLLSLIPPTFLFLPSCSRSIGKFDHPVPCPIPSFPIAPLHPPLPPPLFSYA